MRINDIRLEKETNSSPQEMIFVEVDMEIEDKKSYILRIPINPYEITNSYQPTYQMNGGNVNMNKRIPKQPEDLILDDYMPIVKREVGRVISNKVFSEWDKMEKLKE